MQTFNYDTVQVFEHEYAKKFKNETALQKISLTNWTKFEISHLFAWASIVFSKPHMNIQAYPSRKK